jgi:hypothetical protein
MRAKHAASDATLDRLAATLQAAATADEPLRAALAEGRLAGDLDPAGFGLPLEAAPTEPAAVQPGGRPATSGTAGVGQGRGPAGAGP